MREAIRTSVEQQASLEQLAHDFAARLEKDRNFSDGENEISGNLTGRQQHPDAIHMTTADAEMVRTAAEQQSPFEHLSRESAVIPEKEYDSAIREKEPENLSLRQKNTDAVRMSSDDAGIIRQSAKNQTSSEHISHEFVVRQEKAHDFTERKKEKNEKAVRVREAETKASEQLTAKDENTAFRVSGSNQQTAVIREGVEEASADVQSRMPEIERVSGADDVLKNPIREKAESQTGKTTGKAAQKGQIRKKRMAQQGTGADAAKTAITAGEKAKASAKAGTKAGEKAADKAKNALDRMQSAAGGSGVLNRMQEAADTAPDAIGQMAKRVPKSIGRGVTAGAVVGFAGSVLNRGFNAARNITSSALGDGDPNVAQKTVSDSTNMGRNAAGDSVKTFRTSKKLYDRIKNRELISAGRKARKAAKEATKTEEKTRKGITGFFRSIGRSIQSAAAASSPFHVVRLLILLIILVVLVVLLLISAFTAVLNHQDTLKQMINSRSSNVMVSGGSADAILYHALKNAGYSDEMIAGMLGNFNTETSGGDSGRGRIDPAAVESNGEGHGIAQWSYGRKENLMAYAAQNGPNHSEDDWSNITVQVNFLLKELSEGGYSGTFLSFTGSDELRQEVASAIASSDLGNPPSTDSKYDLVNQCALEWEHVFERSSYAPSFDERIADAQYFYDKIISGGYEGFDLMTLAIPISADGLTITTAPDELEDSSAEPDDASQMYWHPERHGTGQGLGQYHVAVDITNNNSRARAHEEIHPAAYGNDTTVADVGVSDGYGNYVVTVTTLNDGNSLYVLYGHCDTVLVNTGDPVDETTVLATVGSTGRSTGDHVHLALKLNTNPVSVARYNADNAIDANWIWYKQGYNFPHPATSGWDHDSDYESHMREYVKDEIIARFGSV